MIIAEIKQLVEMQAGATVSVAGTGVEITFVSAATATMDNDDVITDSEFTISAGGIESSVKLESVNSKEATVAVDEFIVVIEYADGYSQTCGLRVIRK